MQMTLFGGSIQFEPWTDGTILVDLGLIDVQERYVHYDVEPTAKLKALFNPMPPLESVYPLMIELVLYYRYRRSEPGFVDLRDLERRFKKLGVTEDGMMRLRGMVAGKVRT